MSSPSQAIGLFDSGVGGLTVMKQLMRRLPNERLIYFGDTARVPYGNKSPETIIRYSIENALNLLKKEIKLLVIACNTASAFALSTLRDLSPIPVIGVIEPGVESALSLSSRQRIAILATRATIQSGVYQHAIQSRAPEAILFPIACPLFVPLVEEREWLSHDAARLIVRQYLHPLKREQVDTILLGCTHYPLLSTLIREETGGNAILVDSASTCAEHVAALLTVNRQLSSSRSGSHQYFTSDAPENFRLFAEQLFEHPIGPVQILSP